MSGSEGKVQAPAVGAFRRRRSGGEMNVAISDDRDLSRNLFLPLAQALFRRLIKICYDQP